MATFNVKLTDAHQSALEDILTWRRDVRHFRTDPIPQSILNALRRAMDFAPSVGNARPWRVVEVVSPALRTAVAANFKDANTKAAAIYTDKKQSEYNALKLAGLDKAPVHLAVFTELSPDAGHGLGRQSMPEMLQYSTVTAIHTLWLTARAHNVGVGWVSILDPDGVCEILDVPDTWTLTGYLCIGFATTDDDTPLLHKTAWQKNTAVRWISK